MMKKAAFLGVVPTPRTLALRDSSTLVFDFLIYLLTPWPTKEEQEHLGLAQPHRFIQMKTYTSLSLIPGK